MQTLETLGEDFKCDLVADKRKLALEISKDPGVVNKTVFRISPKFTSCPLSQVCFKIRNCKGVSSKKEITKKGIRYLSYY